MSEDLKSRLDKLRSEDELHEIFASPDKVDGFFTILPEQPALTAVMWGNFGQQAKYRVNITEVLQAILEDMTRIKKET